LSFKIKDYRRSFKEIGADSFRRLIYIQTDFEKDLKSFFVEMQKISAVRFNCASIKQAEQKASQKE